MAAAGTTASRTAEDSAAAIVTDLTALRVHLCRRTMSMMYTRLAKVRTWLVPLDRTTMMIIHLRASSLRNSRRIRISPTASSRLRRSKRLKVMEATALTTSTSTSLASHQESQAVSAERDKRKETSRSKIQASQTRAANQSRTSSARSQDFNKTRMPAACVVQMTLKSEERERGNASKTQTS